MALNPLGCPPACFVAQVITEPWITWGACQGSANYQRRRRCSERAPRQQRSPASRWRRHPASRAAAQVPAVTSLPLGRASLTDAA